MGWGGGGDNNIGLPVVASEATDFRNLFCVCGQFADGRFVDKQMANRQFTDRRIG